jgi:predicted small metal-binding protein
MEETAMDAGPEFTNTCACGWQVTGPEDVVVDATIDHGRRIHNMEATRDQVLAVLHAGAEAGAARGEGTADPRKAAAG